jgi:hypothetical protein
MALWPPTQPDQTHHIELLSKSLRRQTEPERVLKKSFLVRPVTKRAPALIPWAFFLRPDQRLRTHSWTSAGGLASLFHPHSTSSIFWSHDYPAHGKEAPVLPYGLFCLESHKYGGEEVT